jgi:ATP-dependent helicase HrpB
VTLPIDAALPAVVDAARRGPVVLTAETGAGKTTRVPPALLDGGIAGDRLVVVLEPRRVAARAAARRIAEERGWTLGGRVGYHVRLDRRAGADTRILVATEGILLRMLQEDPELSRVGAVVVDEFHERGLVADLVLALLREVRGELRPDLGVVVMSATLDAGPLSAWLGAEAIHSPGRSFPVGTSFLALPDDRPIPEQVADGVRGALAADGDILAFLPGVREIRATAERLADLRDARVLTLYGDLPAESQDAVLRPGRGRRVILATNVAETSLTIPGVRAVVDSGWCRTVRQDGGTGLDRLLLERISRASADQRAGRAGREGPGRCLRLWTEREHRGLNPWTEPEIRRVDLAGPVLQLLAWGEADPLRFPWYEAPSAAGVRNALELLAALGALDEGRLTPIGRRLARLAAPPRIGRMLLDGIDRGASREAALLAGVLSERVPSSREVRDVAELVANPSASARAAAEALLRDADARSEPGSREALDRAVLAGWPDRVARLRETGRRARLIGGRGVTVPGEGPLPAWMVCVDVDAGSTEGIARVIAPIDPSWLATRSEDRLAVEEGRVASTRRELYGDLVVRERPVEAEPRAIEACLVAAATSEIASVIPLSPEFTRLRQRIAFAARHDPTVAVPDDDLLASLLPDLAWGARSFADLRRADWAASLRSRCRNAARVDALAPERIEVPSGSEIRVEYGGERPFLSVRMQELFGLGDTPRVAGGKVPVTLHLLAPNGRPQQITEDLRGFWDRTWPEIRRELRGRYPRHAWPEDPWNARPERKPQRR